jgi:hypothetical protein
MFSIRNQKRWEKKDSVTQAIDRIGIFLMRRPLHGAEKIFLSRPAGVFCRECEGADDQFDQQSATVVLPHAKR